MQTKMFIELLGTARSASRIRMCVCNTTWERRPALQPASPLQHTALKLHVNTRFELRACILVFLCTFLLLTCLRDDSHKRNPIECILLASYPYFRSRTLFCSLKYFRRHPATFLKDEQIRFGWVQLGVLRNM